MAIVPISFVCSYDLASCSHEIEALGVGAPEKLAIVA